MSGKDQEKIYSLRVGKKSGNCVKSQEKLNQVPSLHDMIDVSSKI